ncbi:hypothetical protein [Nesterenkonia sp. PF2B19]|uniref:hypothetical protein n=1 Tax=Nesterenkonia sp. PF2B19 TaxID=1881858 RepID=UPI00087305F6|nr:hypothetical protein [Nesterenkonia sp. PF2B19]OSM42686.1 hypothetical protein BCY76_012835 [Nesterenkonia sp. PF2B19]
MFTTTDVPISTRTYAGTTASRRLAAGSIPLVAAAFALTACTDAEPKVVTETVTETVTEEVEVEVEVEPEDLEEQREAADARDEELDTRETELEDWAEELEELEEALAARESDVETAEEAESDPDDESEASGPTIPGDGVYIVGSDVEPGTYTTEPGSWGCYWARLSGTSGEFHDIITNGFVDDGQALVTIAETDVAFETSGCGVWERQ